MTYFDDKIIAEAATAALRNEGYRLNHNKYIKLASGDLRELVACTSLYVPGFAIRALTTPLNENDTTQTRIVVRVLKEIALASLPNNSYGVHKAVSAVCVALTTDVDGRPLAIASQKALNAFCRTTNLAAADAALAASSWASPTTMAVHAVYAALQSPALPHVRTTEDGWRMVAEIILEEVSRVG